MSDLIKRSDAIKAMEKLIEAEGTMDYTEWDFPTSYKQERINQTEACIDQIRYIPAVEAVPSADRPQGEWIDEADKYDASFGIHDYRCSNCNSYADEHIGGHEWYTADKPNFCPNCGADMREREGE